MPKHELISFFKWPDKNDCTKFQVDMTTTSSCSKFTNLNQNFHLLQRDLKVQIRQTIQISFFFKHL